jgi:hypothetical protein
MLELTINRWVNVSSSSWRGVFHFCVSVFARAGEDDYKRILSKQSSEFVIHSKPQVFIARMFHNTK